VQDFAIARLGKRQGAELLARIVEASRNSGLLRPALGAYSLRLLTCIAGLALCLCLAWFSSSAALFAAGLVGLAWCVCQLAFLAHAALHGALGAGAALGRIFGQVSMTLCGGLGFEEWGRRHREHHLFCQVDGRDPDMAVEFAASLTRGSALRKRNLARAMGRFQGIYVWGLTLLFGHSQRYLSQFGVLAQPLRYRWDLALLAGHYFLWLGLPLLLQVPIARVLAAYLVPATLLGVHFAAVFWVNHVGMPLIRDPRAFSIVERQVVTTRNIRVPPIADAVFGGLNHQIEHHLVPSCPHFRLRALRSVIRPLLVEAGLPYSEMGWWPALRDVGRHFRALAAVMEDPRGATP